MVNWGIGESGVSTGGPSGQVAVTGGVVVKGSLNARMCEWIKKK